MDEVRLLNTKQILALTLGLVSVGGLGWIVGVKIYYSLHQPEEKVCIADTKAGEECPSVEFMKDWRAYSKIRDKYKPSQEDDLLMKGLLSDLRVEAQTKHPGKDWSEEKMKFVAHPLTGPNVPTSPVPTTGTPVVPPAK